MYIAPNTSIILLKNVPLKPDYNETFWFNSTGDQQTFFRSPQHSPVVYSSQSYQRKDRDYLRIEAKYQNVFMYNYMMFQNQSHENKWFYAFITNVLYINENVVEIEYEIDVIQTWLKDLILKSCFVERQHTTTDNYAENLIPERLDTGEYIVDFIKRSGYMDEYATVVCSTLDQKLNREPGTIYGGIFSGLNLIAFDLSEDQHGERPGLWYGLITYLQDAVSDAGSEAINSIFTMPSTFIPAGAYYDENYDPDEHHDYDTASSVEFTVPYSRVTIDGYTPRNKKLFTYPYDFLYVYSTDGNHATYPVEYFNDQNNIIQNNRVVFKMYGTFNPNPEVMLSPKDFKGVDGFNVEESMKMLCGTQCGWSSNAFDAWLAYSASNIPSLALSGIGALAAFESGAPITGLRAGSSFLSQVTNIAGSGIKAAIEPPQIHGNSDGNINVATKTMDFYFVRKHIRAEFARIIDNYFNRFGYAIHNIQVPNIHARQKWTYVKTIDANIEGDIPANDMLKIRSIFDNGVTFWSNTQPTVFGNYDQDNPILV